MPQQTILIADDSETQLLHLKSILESAGYLTITADSGNMAIELSEKLKPDMIMLDIIMANGDGYKACRTIRKNPLLSNTPVIMVSSKSNPVDKQWAKQLGATDYIVKPFEDADVLDKVASF
ncbi:MAG: Two-component system response regulator [uncultured Thiotrichaceae bacterium]|uniref:Two-component system response regulator n=1 Tax=uncultured Thiotrichaceae bacterium TaxID=298394 RepID=A0A6S6S4W4_9GAMM|nr:MAG: Two-component system response regulator [uncultured Thiotrichaceae bacterium]